MAISDLVGIKVGDPGNWMWEDGTRIDNQLRLLKQAAGGGDCYVLVQSHNMGSLQPASAVARWQDACGRHGVIFGIWGVSRFNPESEARVHAAEIRTWRPRIAAINVEIDYQGNPNLGGVELERWNRNHRYLDTFDAESLGPEPPELAMNTTGAASGQSVYWMPHDRWRVRHHVHAQAYFNAYDDYRPDLVEAHWLRAGWPIEKLTMTLGVYSGEGKGLNLRTRDYLPLLQGLRFQGVNLFMAETLLDDDVRDLAQVIAAGHAVNRLTEQPPPPPPPPPPPDDDVPPPGSVDVAGNRLEALKRLDQTVAYWTASGLPADTIARQRQTLAARVLRMPETRVNQDAVRVLLDRIAAGLPLGDPRVAELEARVGELTAQLSACEDRAAAAGDALAAFRAEVAAVAARLRNDVALLDSA